jgi:hypothetical protein
MRKEAMNKRILSFPKHHLDLSEGTHNLMVHSSFKNSLNLVCLDDMVTLQHRDSMKTPMSIVLDLSASEFELLFGQDVQNVQFKNGYLLSQGIAFDFYNANAYDYDLTKVRGLNDNDLDRLKLVLERFISSEHLKGELVKSWKAQQSNQTVPLSVLGEYMRDTFVQLRQTKNQDYIDGCLKLLGTGEGLTPSGDDFLCGLLVSTYFSQCNTLLELRSKLVEALQLHLCSTTEVSQSYLKNAFQGRFMERVIHLQEQTRNKKEIIPVLKQIASMGHSSGADFLVGLMHGIQVGGTI